MKRFTLITLIISEAWCAVAAFWALSTLALMPGSRNVNMALLSAALLNAASAWMAGRMIPAVLDED